MSNERVIVVMQKSGGELSLFGVFKSPETAEKAIDSDMGSFVRLLSYEEHPELYEELEGEQGWDAITDGEILEPTIDNVWGYMITDSIE